MAKKLKRIILASADINHGLSYQRLHLPFMHLKNDYDIVPRNFHEISYTDLFYADGVVMCHAWQEMASHIMEKAKFHYGIPVITDLDDLIFELPTDHPDFANFKSKNCATGILQSTTMNVFSTPYLYNECKHYNTNSHIIENSINERMLAAYKPRFKPHKTGFCVGWTGGQSHRADQLETFTDDLSRFFDNYPEARGYFHVLCPHKLLDRHGQQITFDHLPVNFLDYPAVAAAYPFDVCLVGLQPSRFNEAKSDLKLLEMAPHDIAILASPRLDFIKHKDRDIMLYAENDSGEFKSWYEQLVFCYENQGKLKEMATRAKDYVLNERTSLEVSKKWKAALKTIGF